MRGSGGRSHACICGEPCGSVSRGIRRCYPAWYGWNVFTRGACRAREGIEAQGSADVSGVRDRADPAGGGPAGERALRAASRVDHVCAMPPVRGGECLGACLYVFVLTVMQCWHHADWSGPDLIWAATLETSAADTNRHLEIADARYPDVSRTAISSRRICTIFRDRLHDRTSSSEQ